MSAGTQQYDLALAGMRVFENPSLVVTKTFRRTWRERLLSYPWRPWRATRVESEPDMSIYRIGGGALVGHPAAVAVLREKIQQKGLTP